MPTKKAPAATLVLALALIVLPIGGIAPSAAGEPPLLGPFKDNFTLLEAPRPAPRAVFTDAGGQPVTLQDFAGRVVLLNFWATWCAPCVYEMPDFDRLQADLGGQGLTVIAASQDRGGAPIVEQFYQEYNLQSMGIYLDGSGKLSQEIGVRGLPTTFLIDGAGQIVGALEGPAEWDSPEARALIGYYLPEGKGGAEVVKTGG
ncbi:MAG: TlpA disulfide reductase family protein [Pseudomonadota bacterium]